MHPPGCARHRRFPLALSLVLLLIASACAGPTASLSRPSGSEISLPAPSPQATRAEPGLRARAGPVEAAAGPVEAAAVLPAAVSVVSPEAPPPAAPTPLEPARERAIVAPASFPSRPARPTQPSRAYVGPPGPKEGGVWAVVVGIDDYPGQEADLRAAGADAREVDAALAAYGVPPQHRVVLLDQQASAENIRGALNWLVSRASAEATAVFFYSGHVRQVTGAPDRDGESLDEAIVGAEGESIYDGEVAEILKRLEARTAWIGVAGCYGGGFDDALAPGRILTAAAAEGDLAYENSALGRSYLVEYMVRRAMLQRNAPGSVQEAFGWAQQQIARQYPSRQPVMVDRSKGPVGLGQAAPTGTSQSAPAPEASPSPPRELQPEPQPAPREEGLPGQEACTKMLSVVVCPEKRTGAIVVATRPPTSGRAH